tara:strand:+ start:625 stop:1083 length:459 start_codon:yes stop_codon:yes gene_type:complete
MKKINSDIPINFMDFFKYVLIGILCAYILIYALRPSVPYPELVISIYDNYFIFIILIIINYYLLMWDIKIGLLFLICIISLIFDYYIFIKKDLIKKYNIHEDFNIDNNDSLSSSISPLSIKDKIDKILKNITIPNNSVNNNVNNKIVSSTII